MTKTPADPTRTQVIAAALWAEVTARYPDEAGSTIHTAGPTQPVWQHMAAAVEALLDEKPTATTYSVHWSYTDVFGTDRRATSGPLATKDEADYFAYRTFDDTTPDAWWIESTTTVEYHDMAPKPVKPQYGMHRMDGTVRLFNSKTAAVRYNRELPPLALQYRKGVLQSLDGGKTWEHYA